MVPESSTAERRWVLPLCLVCFAMCCLSLGLFGFFGLFGLYFVSNWFGP